jgi:hypothetical protein
MSLDLAYHAPIAATNSDRFGVPAHRRARALSPFAHEPRRA